MTGLKHLLFFTGLIGLGLSIDMDSSEKRSILVIPFGRFDFHTEVEMEEINKINGSTGEDFYNQVYAGLCEAFILNGNEQVIFRLADDEDKLSFRNKVRFGMKGNTGHFACFPDDLPKSDMKKLLDEYECDYLLSVNWYRIQESRSSVKSGRVKKVRLYTTHMIDCDLFTRECTNIMEHVGK